MYMRAAYSWHAKGSVSFNLFDLSVNGVDGVGGLHLQSDCFSGECFHEYLHSIHC
jgi:hypothetical protein